MLKLQLIGNLGSDPELRFTQGGTATLRFNVAANSRVKNAAGEWTDHTEWVRCTVFGARAEALQQHLVRGLRVYVEGRLEARPWMDRTNSPRAGLEVIADTVEFVSSRRAQDFDTSDLGETASVADERRDRREPALTGARYATGVADEVDLEDLPF